MSFNRYRFQPGLSLMIILAALLALTPLSPALGGQSRATKAETAQDAERFKAMGGIHRMQGFVEFPNDKAPFSKYDRIASARLGGKLVYFTQDGAVIRKNFYCGPHGTVFMELWVPDGKGGTIPFGWQDCMFFCSSGGSPAGSNPLYLDITGNGDPDVRFDWLSDISLDQSKGNALTLTFNGDILPSWVRRKTGSSLKSLSGEKMPAGPSYWRDDAAWVGDIVADGP